MEINIVKILGHDEDCVSMASLVVSEGIMQLRQDQLMD